MSGILDDLFKQMMQSGMPFKPQLVQNELVIEISQQEFYEATTRNLDPRYKQAIKIEFHEGKMVIRVRLF